MSWTDERLARLQLARSHGVGPLTFQSLLRKYETAEAALDALPGLTGVSRQKDFRIASRDTALREVELTEKSGAQILFETDDAYPFLLSQIEPPPPVIVVSGNVSLMARPCIAIVGARNASASAVRIANDLARDLGQAGWVTVSGLARGIDASAHRGSLETGTTGVIAGGIDNIYPRENEALFASLHQDGLILSESAIGYTPKAQDFPRRNRLITGLSRAVIVVEAAKKSGSLISARMALEQNREVMAVPGSPLDPRTRGSNNLIRTGAHLIENADDVIALLSEQSQTSFDFKPEKIASEDPRKSLMQDESLKKVRSALGPTPTTLPDLARACGLTERECAVHLVELELTGEAVSLPGGLIQKSL